MRWRARAATSATCRTSRFRAAGEGERGLPRKRRSLPGGDAGRGPDRRSKEKTRSAGLAVQGLRTGHRAPSAPDRRAGAGRRRALRRAVRPVVRGRGGARAAVRADARRPRCRLRARSRRVAARRPHARVFQRRPGRGGGRRRGEERDGDRRRHLRRPRARSQRARRAHHPRLGRDRAPRRGDGRLHRDDFRLDGRRRPDPHGDRRPFAQPARGTAARARLAAGQDPAGLGACRRGRPFGARGDETGAGPWHRHAGHPGGECRAARKADAESGGRAAPLARSESQER